MKQNNSNITYNVVWYLNGIKKETLHWNKPMGIANSLLKAAKRHSHKTGELKIEVN